MQQSNLHGVAKKLFISELSFLTERSDRVPGFELFGMQMLRIWLQGIVIHVENQDGLVNFFLDDSTGVVNVNCQRVNYAPECILRGQYLMVIGVFTSKLPMVMHAIQVIDLHQDKNSESLWILEVLDIHKTIYNTEFQTKRSKS